MLVLTCNVSGIDCKSEVVTYLQVHAICLLLYTSVEEAYRSGVNPFETLDKSYVTKTRAIRLSGSEDFVILDCVFLIQYQRITDRLMTD